MRKFTIAILILILGLFAAGEVNGGFKFKFRRKKPTITKQTPRPTPKPTQTIKPSPSSFPTPILNSALLNVDFTSQAPFGIWDKTHNDACEEAAMVMAYSWAKNIDLNPEIAEKEILKLVDWQNGNFGFFKDTNAQQTAEMAKKVYGLESGLILKPTLEQLKSELRKGNLIIMPMAGRLLGNPFFRPPGPSYHMLVIKGYDSRGFITNDPGTRHGKDYRYSFETT